MCQLHRGVVASLFISRILCCSTRSPFRCRRAVVMNPLLDLSRKQGKEERIASRFAHLNIRHPKPPSSDTQPATAALSSSTSSTLPTSRLANTNSSLPSSSSASSLLAASHAHSSTSHSQSTLQQSYAALSSASLSALSTVESFHRGRQSIQQQQRTAFTAAQQSRSAQIQTELDTSTTTNNAIQHQFANLTTQPTTTTPTPTTPTTPTTTIQQQDPGQLYTQITDVYRQCLDVLQGKDAIIRELNVIAKEQEDTYIKMLDECEKEVSDVVSLMRVTADEYKSNCGTQLQQLETNCNEERQLLITTQQNELENLYDKRKKMELSRLDNKIVREKREEKELDQLRTRDLEDYYALKVELESSISTFETHLEDMRNMYNLNTEKLHYNHNILMERDHDNKMTMEMYRTRVRKLKELVSNLSIKANEAETKRVEENHNISVEYSKLTTKYKNLQKKLTAFLLNDSKNYDDTRAMHIGQVTALCIKLLHAEKVICEQVLGRPFRYWWADSGSSEEEMGGGGGGGYGGESGGVECVSHDEIQELTAQTLVEAIQQYEDRQRANAGLVATTTGGAGGGGADGGSTALLSSTAVTAASSAAGKLRYSGEQVQAVLDLLCAECHFLIPDTAAGSGTANNEVDGHLLSADALLHALGVEDEEDMDELVSLFYSSPADTTLNVDPNDVATVIRTFVLHRSQSSTAATHSSSTASSSTSPSHSAQHEKRQRRRDKEAAYWSTLGRVNGDGVSEVWEELEGWLVRYNGALDERLRLLEETGGLSRQNEELKNLLTQYQSAKINKELILPPIYPNRHSGNGRTGTGVV